MFTDADVAFLTRLDARADAALAGSDSALQRLRHALASVREVLALDSDAELPASVTEVDRLLDVVWFATTSGDADSARAAAAQLAHSVARLDVPNPRLMRAVSSTLEVRSLVVLTTEQ